MCRCFRLLAKNGCARLSRWTAHCIGALRQFFECIFSAAYAQPPQPVQHVMITLHKSVTLPVPRPFSSAVVGSPNIADAMPLTDRTLYIQGKSVGTTNVSIYDENMRLIKVVDVEVAPDASNLQSKIRASTGNNGIHVANDHGQIVLSGTVSNSTVADKAYNLAKAWVPMPAAWSMP